MSEYLITWQIQLDAESPEEAAEVAREIQLDINADVGFFNVTNENNETVQVKLITVDDTTIH